LKEKLGKNYYQSIKMQEGLEVLDARVKGIVDEKLNKLLKKQNLEKKKKSA
jgi:hypothetical protein